MPIFSPLTHYITTLGGLCGLACDAPFATISQFICDVIIFINNSFLIYLCSTVQYTTINKQSFTIENRIDTFISSKAINLLYCKTARQT